MQILLSMFLNMFAFGHSKMFHKVYELVKAVLRFAIHSATTVHAKAQRKEKLQALRDKCEAEMGISVSKLHQSVRRPTCGCVSWIGCEFLYSQNAKSLPRVPLLTHIPSSLTKSLAQPPCKCRRSILMVFRAFVQVGINKDIERVSR